MSEMNWYSPKVKKPPQGKKILCMQKGDFYIAQRFKDHYVPIPLADSRFAFKGEPTLWTEIDFPSGYHGIMYVQIKEQLFNIDQLEENHSHIFDELVKVILKAYNNEITDMKKKQTKMIEHDGKYCPSCTENAIFPSLLKCKKLKN